MIRVVGLSATLPNYADVATFLRVNPDKGLFIDNRPAWCCSATVRGVLKEGDQAPSLVNGSMYEKVLSQAENQVLVFVHSRKECAKTARAIRDVTPDANADEFEDGKAGSCRPRRRRARTRTSPTCSRTASRFTTPA